MGFMTTLLRNLERIATMVKSTGLVGFTSTCEIYSSFGV